MTAVDGPRLLVIDRCDPQFLREAGRTGARSWLVLPLVVSEAALRRRCGAELAALGDFQIVDVGSMADEALEQVRTFVVDELSTLQNRRGSTGTIAETLSGPTENLWWYLEVSERGSFRQPLIQQLYQLALIRLAIDRHPCRAISVGIADARLSWVAGQAAGDVRVHLPGAESAAAAWRVADTALYWRRAIAAVARLAGTRLVATLLRGSVPEPRASATAFFTFYPMAWWLSPFGFAPMNRFFSTLPQDGYFAAWLGSPLQLLRRLGAVRHTISTKRVLPLQMFARFRDARPVLSPARFLRARAAMRQARDFSVRFAGFEVGGLIADAIRASLTGGEAPEDLLMARTFSRFVDRHRPGSVVFRAEFQPSENALLLGCAERTQTIGFMHHPFGRYFLPMQFSPQEMERLRSRRSGRDRPMPDGYLVSGAAGKRHLMEVGVPAASIAACGPQRFQPLMEYCRRRETSAAIRGRLGLPAGAPLLFVATAVLEADNDALLAAVVDGCRGLPAYRLIIKPHPNFPDGDAAIQRTLADLGPQRATLLAPSVSMYDAIAASDGMVSSGSTIVFEAMVLGVMPIAFENPGTFAASSVREFAAGLYSARSADELRRAIEDVIDGAPEVEARRRHWPRLIADGLGDLETPLERQLTHALTGALAS